MKRNARDQDESMKTVKTAEGAPAGQGLGAKHLQELVKEQMTPTPGGGGAREAVMRIPVTIQVILGTARVPVATAMEFGPGSTIVLDQRLGEPVRLVANGREIARGEIIVIDEETSQLGISLTEVTGEPKG
jgi:flagellar motor switch protein FliN